MYILFKIVLIGLILDEDVHSGGLDYPILQTELSSNFVLNHYFHKAAFHNCFINKTSYTKYKTVHFIRKCMFINLDLFRLYVFLVLYMYIKLYSNWTNTNFYKPYKSLDNVTTWKSPYIYNDSSQKKAVFACCIANDTATINLGTELNQDESYSIRTSFFLMDILILQIFKISTLCLNIICCDGYIILYLQNNELTQCLHIIF